MVQRKARTERVESKSWLPQQKHNWITLKSGWFIKVWRPQGVNGLTPWWVLLLLQLIDVLLWYWVKILLAVIYIFLIVTDPTPNPPSSLVFRKASIFFSLLQMKVSLVAFALFVQIVDWLGFCVSQSDNFVPYPHVHYAWQDNAKYAQDWLDQVQPGMNEWTKLFTKDKGKGKGKQKE